MNKLLFILLSMTFAIMSYAQDKLILKNGEELIVKVTKNEEKTIEFQYPGETLVNVKNKNQIKKIIYASGRVEDINQGIEVPEIKSPKDWQKVVVTYLESDVEGLQRVDEIKTTSGWGGSLGSSIGYKDCLNRLKKKAAKLGAGVILVHGQTNQFAAAKGGGVQLTATAYK